MLSGPVPSILAAQSAQGYWLRPGAGYSPKYQSTVWQIIFRPSWGQKNLMTGLKRAAIICLNITSPSAADFLITALPQVSFTAWRVAFRFLTAFKWSLLLEKYIVLVYTIHYRVSEYGKNRYSQTDPDEDK
ncbi:hypothetical protein SDC9_07093 [bioreactor metagenome]|jgi:hypothetical protein|nr:hypothetical protein C1O63_0700 [Dehalococcoides mccartyi]